MKLVAKKFIKICKNNNKNNQKNKQTEEKKKDDNVVDAEFEEVKD